MCLGQSLVKQIFLFWYSSTETSYSQWCVRTESFISFVFEYFAMKAPNSQDGLELNVTHHLLDSTANVSMWAGNIYIVNTNTESLLVTNRDIGLEVTNHLTNQITPRSRVILEKLTVLFLVKKFPTFYENHSSITLFTVFLHLSLS
jgi:hypothetical protein